MKAQAQEATERQLQLFCQQAAFICHSKEFKQLNKEMSKLYRRNGIHNFKIVAFQDSLFSLYLEVHDGKLDTQQLQML